MSMGGTWETHVRHGRARGARLLRDRRALAVLATCYIIFFLWRQRQWIRGDYGARPYMQQAHVVSSAPRAEQESSLKSAEKELSTGKQGDQGGDSWDDLPSRDAPQLDREGRVQLALDDQLSRSARLQRGKGRAAADHTPIVEAEQAAWPGRRREAARSRAVRDAGSVRRGEQVRERSRGATVEGRAGRGGQGARTQPRGAMAEHLSFLALEAGARPDQTRSPPAGGARPRTADTAGAALTARRPGEPKPASSLVRELELRGARGAEGGLAVILPEPHPRPNAARGADAGLATPRGGTPQGALRSKAFSYPPFTLPAPRFPSAADATWFARLPWVAERRAANAACPAALPLCREVAEAAAGAHAGGAAVPARFAFWEPRYTRGALDVVAGGRVAPGDALYDSCGWESGAAQACLTPLT